MTKIRVLLVDNHPEYLLSTAELLQLSNMEVITAASVAEAQARLADSYVHLGVFDVRLIDNDDENDLSGLTLARESGLPSLILTLYPSLNTAVTAFTQDENAAIDFVDKADGTDALITAIERAAQKHLHIKWDLEIHWQTVNNFAQMAYFCQPEMSSDFISARTTELTDLFCQLFYAYKQITIGQALSQQNGRVILPVFAYDAAGVEAQFLVSCGQRAETQAEEERYEKYLAHRSGFQYIGYQTSAVTLHFGANAFPYLAGRLEAVESLQSVYHGRSTTAVLAAIDHLYQNNLGTLYASGRQKMPKSDLIQFFEDWLPSAWDLSLLGQKIAGIAQQAAANQLAQVQVVGSQLHFQLDAETQLNLPHPGMLLHNGRFELNQEMAWGVTHGRVQQETVFVADSGAAWVVDFTQVGRAPLLIDFVSLETAVKYDLLENGTIEERFHLWQHLMASDDLGQLSEGIGLSDRSYHAFLVIGRIRQNAASLAGCDLLAYQQALFGLALAHIATFQPEKFYPYQALVTFASAVLEAALLAENMGAATVNETLPTAALTAVWLDEKNKSVWVEGREITNLTRLDFVILKYLVDHANQLCSYADIVREGLGQPYDKFDRERERQRLYNAIGRLRTKIEADPKSPKFLLTVPGHGYRLRIER